MRISSTFALILTLASAACVASSGSGNGNVADGQATSPDGAPTYYQDIRPILQTRCSGCHKPGEIAPFSLVSYADAKQNASAAALASHNRLMPPFPPDPTNCEPLDDPRIMSDSERDLLDRWAAAGAPEGDASKPAPDLPAAAEVLGDPTDTWNTGVDYTPAPPAGVLDDYHCFIIDPQVATAIPYHAVDVAAGNRTIAHHASVYVAASPEAVAAARALDDAEPGPGYTCFGDTQVDDVDEIGGWVPGEAPQAYPDNTASYLHPGSVFVLQMHYNIATGSGSDRPTVRLWRPTAPITQSPNGFDVENYDFEIPPRAANISASGSDTVIPSLQIPSDSEANEGLLWQVGLHTHLLAQATRMDLVHADGSTQCLLNIPKWNFGWQGSYNFANPVKLVAGDTVRVSCTWNNPTDQTVGYGNTSEQEMCQGWGTTTTE